MTKADIAEHQPSPFSLMNFKLLRLTFDNSGAILLGISGDKSAWIQSVDRARANAPELPYTTMPAEFSKSGSYSIFLWVAAGILGLFSCMASIFFLGALITLPSNS